MWPSTYGVLAKLMGKFSGNSTYSELPSISPELAIDMTSLSGLAGHLGVVVEPSGVSAQFGFILPLLMAAGVEV